MNERNVILCELCFDIEKVDNIKDNEKEFGVIRTKGVEEPKTDNDPLPRTFLNLKNIIKQHVGTYYSSSPWLGEGGWIFNNSKLW